VVQPNGIAVLPDGSRAYVTDHQCQNSFIFIVDLSTFTVVGNIPYGCFPAGIAVTPDGSQV
jgi:YVTN family beta-propeller protein